MLGQAEEDGQRAGTHRRRGFHCCAWSSPRGRSPVSWSRRRHYRHAVASASRRRPQGHGLLTRLSTCSGGASRAPGSWTRSDGSRCGTSWKGGPPEGSRAGRCLINPATDDAKVIIATAEMLHRPEVRPDARAAKQELPGAAPASTPRARRDDHASMAEGALMLVLLAYARRTC